MTIVQAGRGRKLVSIIIDGSEGPGSFEDAVGSALSQTYSALEVILVVDVSPEERSELTARFRGQLDVVIPERVRHLTLLHAGVASSAGDVLIFLDADKSLDAVAVERVMHFFDDRRIAKAHWWMKEVDEEGRPTGAIHPWCSLPQGPLRERLLDEGPESCSYPPLAANAWARWLFEAVSPSALVEHSSEGRSGTVEGVLSAASSLLGGVQRVPEPLTSYRTRSLNEDSQGFDERVRRRSDVSARQRRELARLCLQQGIQPDLAGWDRKSWWWQAERALQAIERMTSSSDKVVIVDDGCGLHETQRVIAIPFLEHDGQYWGRPADDSTAINEIERMQEEGASLLVFLQPAFWWLQHYHDFARHLRESFDCISDVDILVAFDLRRRRRGQNATTPENGHVDRPRVGKEAVVPTATPRPAVTEALHPAVGEAVEVLLSAAGGRLRVKSGRRSYEEQTLFWVRALARYGSAEKASQWVRPPGLSSHETGTAVDIGGDAELARQLIERFQLPLFQPYPHEPWHLELVPRSTPSGRAASVERFLRPRFDSRTAEGVTLLADGGARSLGVGVCFSDRLGGVSHGPYEALNLAMRVGDDSAHVAENRRRVAAAADFDLGSLVLSRQVHGTTVREVTHHDRGVVGEADALVTRTPDTVLGLLTADCAPVVLASDDAVAVVHAGWRGLAKGLIQMAVEALGGVRCAWVGPAVRACCYEVGPEVVEAFAVRQLPVAGPRRVDIAEAARAALLSSAVEEIAVSGVCTGCDGRFFSARAGSPGRQGAFVWIIEP